VPALQNEQGSGLKMVMIFFLISVEDVPYHKKQTAAFDTIDDNDKSKDAWTSRFKIFNNQRGQQGEGENTREIKPEAASLCPSPERPVS